MKQFIADYFNFTRKERNGTLALLLLIAVLIIAPFLFPFFIKTKQYEHDTFKKQIAALKIKQADSTAKYRKQPDGDETPDYFQGSPKKYGPAAAVKSELFPFDPNTLDETGWHRLGLRDKTIGTIKNYLSKGGKFKQPEDIKKIWGIEPELAERILPYVQIAAHNTATENRPSANKQNSYEKPVYRPTLVDVNSADTAAFIALPGIGSKLAQRIVSFREKLGGFYKIEQVGETFGLPDSTFQLIKNRLIIADPSIKQLNINTATLEEMKAHPYLRYTIANAIVQFRSQHGNFSSIHDLKKIVSVTEEIFVKASPYLAAN